MPRLGDTLGRHTLRYMDPESEPGTTECVDVSPGTWLKQRPKKGDKGGQIRRVLRVDVQARAVRFDLGSDDENNLPENRVKWERVLSLDTEIPFFDVVPEPKLATKGAA